MILSIFAIWYVCCSENIVHISVDSESLLHLKQIICKLSIAQRALTNWGRDRIAAPFWHFKCNFLNENVWISITISLKFVPKDPINNIPTLVQIMATNHCLNQFWLVKWRVYASLGPNEFIENVLLIHWCIITSYYSRERKSIITATISILVKPWFQKQHGTIP